MNPTTTATTIGNTTGSALFPKKKKGEPHRIYWQQWSSTTRKSGTTSNSTASTTASAVNTNSTTTTSWVVDETSLLSTSSSSSLLSATKAATTTTSMMMNDDCMEFQQYKNFNRRELIMSSVAIRLSRAAKVMDVTKLLRQTILQLPDPTTMDASLLTTLHEHPDCLVLVGTIYTLHKGFIHYQHQQPITFDPDAPQTSYDEPYHIIHTLQPEDNPLLKYEKMEQYIINFLDRYHQIYATNTMNGGTSTTFAMGDHHPTTTTSGNDTQNDSIGPTSVATTATATPAIAPKIQWYYIPAVTTNNPDVDHNKNHNHSVGALIPNCVELDGYCTSMEENDDDNSDDDNDINDENVGHVHEHTEGDEQDSSNILSSAFPWMTKTSNSNNSPTITMSHGMHKPRSASRPYSTRVQNKLQHEEYLYNEFCTAESQTPPHACIKGYLLYRNSQHDLHAWTRMYCVLTNNELWFVSRIYTQMDHSTPSAANVANQRYRYVRHGRVRLIRAMLIQPTTSEPSFFRIPYSFEIVASDGTSHLFRTGSKYQQTVWMTAISERIITSYECSLLDNAQLIMTEECYARNRRATTMAVEPLWDQAIRVMNDGHQSHHSEIQQHPSIGNSIGSVLRFGMDISIYKDRCRFVCSTMPTRTPIVVAAPTQPLRRRFFSSSSSSAASESRESSISDAVKYEPYPVHIQNMIRITWDQATALLTRARSLALTLHVRSSIMHRHDVDNTDQQHESSTTAETTISHSASPRPIRLSHGIDTLCRHIDFVLTGRLDMSSPSSSQTQILLDHGAPSTTTTNLSLQQEDGPPPDDLFDHLLTELQLLAASADYYHIHHKRGGDSDASTTVHPSTRTPTRQ